MAERLELGPRLRLALRQHDVVLRHHRDALGEGLRVRVPPEAELRLPREFGRHPVRHLPPGVGRDPADDAPGRHVAAVLLAFSTLLSDCGSIDAGCRQHALDDQSRSQ